MAFLIKRGREPRKVTAQATLIIASSQALIGEDLRLICATAIGSKRLTLGTTTSRSLEGRRCPLRPATP